MTTDLDLAVAAAEEDDLAVVAQAHPGPQGGDAGRGGQLGEGRQPGGGIVEFDGEALPAVAAVPVVAQVAEA